MADPTAKFRIEVEAEQASRALDDFEQRFNDLADVGRRVMESWEAVGSFLERGGRFGDVMDAVKVDVAAVAAAVDNQITAFDAAVASNRAYAAGLKLSTQDMQGMVLVAKQFADATGTDLPQALDKLTSAVIRGNERGLKPFGLEAGSVAEILEQVEEKADGLSGAADDAGDSVTKLKVAWDDLVDSLSAAAASDDGPLFRTVSGLTDLVDSFRSLATESDAASAGFVEFGQQLVSGVIAPASTAVVALDELATALDAAAAAAAGEQYAIGGVEPRYIDMDRGGTRGTRLSFQPNEGTGRLAGSPRRRGGGGGRGRQGPTFEEVMDRAGDLGEEAFGQEAQTEDAFRSIERLQEESWNARLTIEKDRGEEMLELRRDMLEEERQIEQERQRIWKDGVREKEAARKEEERIDKENRRALETSVSTLGGVLRQGTAAMGGSKSLESTLVGIQEEVLAVSSFAAQDYLGGAAHQAAAIFAFTSAAEQESISGAGGGGGRRGGGSALARQRAARPGGTIGTGGGVTAPVGTYGMEGGGGTTVINVVIDTAGTGYVPDDVTQRFWDMKELANIRHGADPRA